MSDGFIIRPLKCDRCGAELPVMGQLVTFQCTTCHSYWMLTTQGLKTMTVYRAVRPEGFEDEKLLHLPFWIVPIDGEDLRDQMTGSLKAIMEIKQRIVSTDFEMEQTIVTDGFLAKTSDIDPNVRKAAFINDAAGSKIAPSSSEIKIALARIENVRNYYIFVPAFLTANTFAYLKVGRLMTLRQPPFRAQKYEGLDHPVLCALQAEEAAAMIDYVFFATLPESMQFSGDFMKDVTCRPTALPLLVEFPFVEDGASLHNIHGRFHISKRLVEQSEPAETISG